MGDDDTTLEQHLLDQPQAQWETEVQPDRMSDDQGREPMAFVAYGIGHARLSTRLALIPELM
jgi:hypothetical protein